MAPVPAGPALVLVRYRKPDSFDKTFYAASGAEVQHITRIPAPLALCGGFWILSWLMARHMVTLSFDDGFAKSSLKTAEIHEQFGLAACFNVIASAHMPGFVPPNESLKGLGDFGLWRELAARGHEIMPHGYAHERLDRIPLSEARELTLRCLDVFEGEMPGFSRSGAVYNCPYNASSAEVEAWLPTVVRAFRTGWEAINPLPARDTVKLTCVSFGPENAEADIDQCVERLLSLPEGWLIYNTHGLDGEGWGPIGSGYLRRLLERLLAAGTVRIIPAAAALRLADSVDAGSKHKDMKTPRSTKAQGR